MAVQRDLHHWVPLLNHFDGVLEAASKALPRLDSSDDASAEQAQQSAPTQQNLLGVLRVTHVLLKHCVNKQIYGSLQMRLQLACSYC